MLPYLVARTYVMNVLGGGTSLSAVGAILLPKLVRNSTWRYQQGCERGRGKTHKSCCSHLRDILSVGIIHSLR